MKTLSFIIPSYNSARFLDTVIPSMLAPEVMEELDIIIVNDGSTDGTEQEARKYCEAYPGTVRLINQENKGHGGALNTGCAAAVGKYLKVIDADDWVETQNLAAFVHFLGSCNSDVVLTHHYTRDISTGEIKKWRSYPAEFGRAYFLDEIVSDWRSFDRSLTFHGITYNTAFYQKNCIQLSEHVFYEDYEFAAIPCCFAKSVTPVDLFIYDYRIGDVQQSVSDANQLKRRTHTEAVLKRLISESEKLNVTDAGREYLCRKTQELLLSYITTTMLVDPDRRAGRQRGDRMMALFREKMPRTYELAVRQYRVFRLMNMLGIRKQTWEKILASKAYNRLRHRHDFQ